MIHKIKCPRCKAQWDLDLGDKMEGASEFAITKCIQCGFPLVNKNHGDNWEVLKPSDMMGLPPELQFMIAEQIVPPEEMASMKETIGMMKEGMASTTPLDRARIFVPMGVCNSEGCVLVLGPNEWGKFAAIANIRDRMEMRDALHFIITKDYEQKVLEN